MRDDPRLGLRSRAVGLLARSPRASDVALLPEYAESSDLPLRTAALRAWATTADVECDAYLLRELSRGSPQLQQVLVELVSQKPERLAALAKQLSERSITPNRIGAVDLGKLAARATGDTQQQLNLALESILNSNRSKVVADYQGCLTLSGDAARGRELFTKHCASCHKIANIGVQVAPDISDSRTQTAAQLLTNILDPNRVIDNNYFRFVALTKDERILEGIIAEETSDAIVLRGQNDTRQTLKREDLQELKATGTSMMPEGLESQIDQQAMADLISFVKNWRYLDGSVPAAAQP